MIKAFLSHSSLDKDIVRQIKVRLQRIWTYFDEDCFEAGEDFRSAITTRLSDTKLFVLFASRNSLSSAWVKFELDEAFWQQVKRENISFVVLTLGDINVNQLPDWMKKAKFESVTSPKIAAQLIRKLLFDDTSVNKKVYLGREQETIKILEDINQMTSDFPCIIALTGLNGIGRRTFASDIFGKRFSLDYKAEFLLDEAEGIIELYRKLIDENMERFSSQDIIDSYNMFSALSFSQQIGEIARMLALYTENKSYPVIVDNGAMLDDNGYYKKEFLELLRFFSNNFPDHYLLLIHKRLPQLDHCDSMLVYRMRLNALDTTSCYTVLDAMLKRNNVIVRDAKQVQEIASYLDGYPPAIIFAVRECILEGVDIVCNNKVALMDFQSGTFNKYLNTLPLNEIDNLVLCALFNLGDMTIQIIASVLDETVEDIAVSLRKCLDFNIIEERSNGMYGIALPISVAVSRKFQRYSNTEFSRIAHTLIENFWDTDTIPNIDIINVIIQTILNANLDNELQKFKNLILPSNLLRAAKDANNNQNWGQAEKYARMALDLDNTLDDARNILFKVLVRQENQKNYQQLNNEQNDLLKELGKNSYKRTYYLAGFREWKRNHFNDAIVQFKLGKSAGDDSIQLHRDLAECLYQIDNIPEAQKEINIVMEPPRKIKNAFILDLASKIAINAGDFDSADALLIRQELVDHPENIEHRKATYYIKRDDHPTAMVHATNACQGNKHLPQMHLLRMNIGIHTEQFDIVETEYKYIKENFYWYNPDICEILFSNMLLKRNGWQQAEASFNNIHNKSSSVALSLKYKILCTKLADRMLPIIERNRAEIEKATINSAKTRDVLVLLQFYDGRKDNVDTNI